MTPVRWHLPDFELSLDSVADLDRRLEQLREMRMRTRLILRLVVELSNGKFISGWLCSPDYRIQDWKDEAEWNKHRLVMSFEVV